MSRLAELQEAGAQAVATAMMATLPGIDANDPRKTLACFRFYCVVLSSVGRLQVWAPPNPQKPLHCLHSSTCCHFVILFGEGLC